MNNPEMNPEKINQPDSNDLEKKQKILDVAIKIEETRNEITKELEFINALKGMSLVGEDSATMRRKNNLETAENKLHTLQKRLQKLEELRTWRELSHDNKYSVKRTGSWKEGQEHSDLVKLHSILKDLASHELGLLAPVDRVAANEELLEVEIQMNKNTQQK